MSEPPTNPYSSYAAFRAAFIEPVLKKAAAACDTSPLGRDGSDPHHRGRAQARFRGHGNKGVARLKVGK